MWNSFIKLTHNGAEQLVAVYFVLPVSVYQEFKDEIHDWTNGEFNVNAAYNIVPVAFTQGIAQLYKIPLVSLDPEHDTTPIIAKAYTIALKDLSQSDLSRELKLKHFSGLHSHFRESLNHYNDVDALQITPFMNRGDLSWYFDTNRQAAQDYHRSPSRKLSRTQPTRLASTSKAVKPFGKRH